MSYAPGTDLGSLRELIGDTSSLREVFEDDYLNAVLDNYADNVGLAAVAVLERLQNDPDLIRQKYQGLGKFGINELVAIQRSVGEQAKRIKDSYLSSVATSSTDTRFPSSDVDRLGGSTDDSGWNIESNLQTYQESLDSKLT